MTNRIFKYIMDSALLRVFFPRVLRKGQTMLDLKKLLDGSLNSIDFSLSLDDCSFIDDLLGGTAVASGTITNHSGLILLSGNVLPVLKVSCARCGREYTYNTPIALNAKITDKLANEDEDEFIIMQDFAIDIEDIVRTALILELPTRYLCKEDCKGLCVKCGINLNENTCNCETRERDSRWDVLKDYFD